MPCIHDKGLGTDWHRTLREQETSVNLLNDTSVKLLLYYMYVIQAWHPVMVVQITSQIGGSRCSGRCYERGQVMCLERPGTTRLNSTPNMASGHMAAVTSKCHCCPVVCNTHIYMLMLHYYAITCPSPWQETEKIIECPRVKKKIPRQPLCKGESKRRRACVCSNYGSGES